MSASKASPPPASLHIAGNALQGLFVRALPPEPAFHADLKALGVDVERLLPQYPLRVTPLNILLDVIDGAGSEDA